MKTIVKSALVALTVSVFAIPASAVECVAAPVSVQDTIVKKDTVVKEDTPMFFAQSEVVYTKIEVSEVPAQVSEAVAAKYEGYTIAEAAKGSDNSYKLVIKKEEASLTVYFDENGGFLKEETPAEETVVA